MSAADRARSPSAGQRDGIRDGAPAPPHDTSTTSTTSTLQPSYPSAASTQYNTSAPHSYDQSLPQDPQQSSNYLLGSTYADLSNQHKSELSSHNIDLLGQEYLQSQALNSSGNNANFNYGIGATGMNTGSLGGGYDQQGNLDSSAFPSFDFNSSSFDPEGVLDPSLLADIDPNNLDLLPSQANLDASGTSLNPMATMQQAATTPPHLLPDMARRQSGSPSPHASPNSQQANLQQMNRGRAVSESLDPSSAMFPPGQNEWSHMYSRHRHTPSETFSDISSHSNQASPYLQTLDSFDANAHSSPLLNPSQDPVFSDGLGLQQFSLSDQSQHQQFYPSPGHSPHISPRLSPQQPLPAFTAVDNFGLNAGMDGQFMMSQQPNGSLDMFPGMGQEPFPSLANQNQSEMGHADAMSPPEINIDYAPPAKNPVENARTGLNDEALSPPLRSTSRNRMRAKSDSYAGSRPSSPSVLGRGRSPSLQPTVSATDNLSPFDNRSQTSRSPSPASGPNGSASRGRSSSNASDQRDYILDLANPERTPSSGGDRRQQKHPATFQCTLCPKRFTRAYNLRSHLRTHTDERPFVCTVCGKAFARQHDRKRHEGLHSGEKKFVCRGSLQSGSQWGCGRRFARADALGRHFRSEAGRVCIKPLLDEEAAERQKVAAEEQQQHAQNATGMLPSQPLMSAAPLDLSNFLPAAILQQYPALAGIDWNAVPQGAPLEEDYSGRSSFDASSGGEFYDEMSDNEMNAYQDQQMGGMNSLDLQQAGLTQNMGMGAASNAQNFGGMYGTQVGEYISDFEGR